MNATIERRDFLRQAMIAGLVIGFPASRVVGDEAPGDGASLLAQARAEMARRAAPGVVLVASRVLSRGGQFAQGPDIDQLNRLFGGSTAGGHIGFAKAYEPKPELSRLFARAVFVYASEAEVQKVLGAEAARAAVLLLDPAGSLSATVPRDAAWDGGADDALVQRLVALVDGPEGAALEAAAAHQRGAFAGLAAALDLAIARLDAPEFAAREEASGDLIEACDRLGNVLVRAARRTDSLEVRTRIEAVLTAYVARLGARASFELEGTPVGDTFLLVPLGVQWGHQRDYFNCPPCGRGSASDAVRRYLTLVAGAGK